jgi:hypothetical protein
MLDCGYICYYCGQFIYYGYYHCCHTQARQTPVPQCCCPHCPTAEEIALKVIEILKDKKVIKCK